MCYHRHYIFLACGHSVYSPRPMHPGPRCPNQPAPADNMTAAERPFSFDPSVIASPLSPHSKRVSANTPWRLEGPFITPDSPSPASNQPNADENGNGYFNKKPLSTIATTTTPDGKENTQATKGDNSTKQANQANQRTHCGQILIHPYRSYKIEGSCLHCQRRRDTLLATFEVAAIRDNVYRESLLGLSAGAPRRFGTPASRADGEGGDGGGGEAMPLQLPMLGRSVQFQSDGLKEEQGQQQQTPWRLTLPPAEVPRNGWGLAGMRDGEWI